jgi:hypothetical protein
MIVDQDHYINAVFHEPGEHDLAVEQFDTSFVLVACRILVDPNEPTDVATVKTLQDQLRVTAGSARIREMPMKRISE